MKKKKLTALTLMLATAVVSTAFGGAILAHKAAADADTYTLSEVFVATDATLGTETLGEGENANKVTAFTLKNDGSVTMKRSLALKWFEERGKASYFTMKFAFKSLNFKSVTIAMDSTSAWATKDEKTTNSVKFTNEDGVIKVSVNDGEAKISTIAKEQELTLSLTESTDKDGEFGVGITGVEGEIGKFVNIGANYAEYSSNEQYPLTISAEAAEGAEGDAANTVVLLYDINGQSFDNLTSDNKITDDAAPVLVVNEAVNGFLLGTAFSLDYTAVDVLKSKSLTNTLEYYQYNPNYELKENDENFKKYKSLSTSVYFMDTVCYVKDGKFVAKGTDGAKATTVFKEKGKELVSVKLKTKDGANEGTYDLAWYASEMTTISGVDYLTVDKNTESPSYTHLKVEGEENKLVNQEEYEKAKAAFEESLAKAAEDVYAGSNSYIYFPSFKWLIGDNNGYRNLKFTISYKEPTSDRASGTSNLSYNTLKLAAESEGKYEFKIFANDKAGNEMKYYIDGELVKLTTSNVWDIEEIPSFTYEIANKGLKIEDGSNASSKKETKVLDKTYTLDDIDVVGASSSSNLKENYKLYKVDRSKYNDGLEVSEQLTAADLYSITYQQLQGKIDLKTISSGANYLDEYLNAYVALLAEKVGATSAEDIKKIKDCFVEVKEYDSRITEENAPEEWNAYNKYEWSVSSQSFKTVEEGAYLIMADYWEAELASSQRVAAYKVVIVESEADVIKGENDWLKNNVVSVVLFSIAGVMAILIVILLLIKPSDETLEDVDAAVAKSKEKKNKDK